MASLTGMAFQIDFLVGGRSRRDAVSKIQDTVDSINTIAREGASRAAKERRKKLEEDLGELEALSKQATTNMVKTKEDAAKAVGQRAGRSAGSITRKMKTDTSGLDKYGKKAVSVAKQMKGSFKDLNKAISARSGIKKLAGESFTQEKTVLDYASREAGERERLLKINQQIYDDKKKAGKLMEGDIQNMNAMKELHEELLAIEKDESKTQAEIRAAKSETINKFNQANRDEQEELRKNIMLRQEQARAIGQVATSIGTTLRQSFIYSTAAIGAFYYKLNAVNTAFVDFEKELINAQSIFQTTNEVLFSLSDQIANFGLTYGIELQNASTGLYQLASAGLSASDSMAVLNDTLMLSMAVQGDHNTIAKLTTQTIFGFGLEMSDSSILVDKFAWSINKSLIEYQDLAAAVKFAMPFFVATGQSVDQLLGSIQVLTNRALEAGIAGRGLRQALSEFAEGAEDSTRTFAKLGVKVIDAQGNFLQLTEIARNFKNVFGEAATDVELMTTLLEDLNVRGATAFVHLVQNVDEFEDAVNDLQNSAGAATKMAGIQQKALSNQIQILKTSLMAPFIITDKIGEANGYMNEFQMTLHQVIYQFSSLIYDTLPDGSKVLTDIGIGMKQFIIAAMKELGSLLQEGMQLFKKFAREVGSTEDVLHLVTVPLRVMLKVMEILGPEGIKFIIMWKVLNGVLPVTSVLLALLNNQTLMNAAVSKIATYQNIELTAATYAVGIAASFAMAGMGALLMINLAFGKSAPGMAKVLSVLAGAVMGIAIAYQVWGISLTTFGWGMAGAIAVGMASGLAFSTLMTKLMQTPDLPEMAIPEYDISGSSDLIVADLGMRIPVTYDTGGRPNHRMILAEGGETITSKSMNMIGGNQGLDGGANGLAIHVYGDVYDAENFSAKIAQVLPNALRNVNDVGGI